MSTPEKHVLTYRYRKSTTLYVLDEDPLCELETSTATEHCIPVIKTIRERIGISLTDAIALWNLRRKASPSRRVMSDHARMEALEMHEWRQNLDRILRVYSKAGSLRAAIDQWVKDREVKS